MYWGGADIPSQGVKMKDFSLKKYKITQAFGAYKKGEIVAFNGVDAENFGKYLEPMKTEEKKSEKISKK